MSLAPLQFEQSLTKLRTGDQYLAKIRNDGRQVIYDGEIDYPLSSRFDDTDALITLDNVFVPWERVFEDGVVWPSRVASIRSWLCNPTSTRD